VKVQSIVAVTSPLKTAVHGVGAGASCEPGASSMLDVSVASGASPGPTSAAAGASPGVAESADAESAEASGVVTGELPDDPQATTAVRSAATSRGPTSRGYARLQPKGGRPYLP
jgi:hypothetical protein